MKKETRIWLVYAKENLKSAKVLLDHDLYNPSLHNMQQSIEKYAKAVLLEKTGFIKKTHSIREIIDLLSAAGVILGIDDDAIDLMDSIYLTTKYPMGSAMPDFYPDKDFCLGCFKIADKFSKSVEEVLGN